MSTPEKSQATPEQVEPLLSNAAGQGTSEGPTYPSAPPPSYEYATGQLQPNTGPQQEYPSGTYYRQSENYPSHPTEAYGQPQASAIAPRYGSQKASEIITEQPKSEEPPKTETRMEKLERLRKEKEEKDKADANSCQNKCLDCCILTCGVCGGCCVAFGILCWAIVTTPPWRWRHCYHHDCHC